ncbi:MAG: hypothetical protein QF632_04735 [Candidatus Woesearchaeota archaeon]|jgi:uncharacterized membrane protein|nr:hypothetical protein [Candidatus Woesearchaeota archaeon]MDP7324039.1 hypothetical protein [Candidatus Woesearchaeota archaeon]MDP7457470.1 hypothetical protein [Candidatus Woesearchaeota archaeon]
MKIDNRIVAGVCLLIVLGLAAHLFQFTGVRTIIGMLLLFVVPAYMILDNFDLEQDEKLFFAFFISISLFTLFTWYVDRILPSLRLSLAVSFILLVCGGYALKRYRKGRSHKQLSEGAK